MGVTQKSSPLANFGLIAICVIIALVVFMGAGFGKTTFKMRENCYAVPNKFLFSSPFLENLLQNLQDLQFDESGAEMYLRFPARYVAEKVPGYTIWVHEEGGIKDDVTPIFGELSPENVRYIESGIHDQHLWTATGDYSDDGLGQEIIWDDGVQLFRVYFAKISRGWTFVDLDPRMIDEDLPSGNHVIAGCRNPSGINDGSYSCLHSTLRGNFSIEYYLNDNNFPLYREIDDFIFEEIESWKFGVLTETGDCRIE